MEVIRKNGKGRKRRGGRERKKEGGEGNIAK